MDAEQQDTLRLEAFAVLRAVFHHQPKLIEEYEVERRYQVREGVHFSHEELIAQGAEKFRDMAQVYLVALDTEGNEQEFRLRRTFRPEEGHLLRVARKVKRTQDYNPAGREESQLIIALADTTQANLVTEFETLWLRGRWAPLKKRRYYFTHRFERPHESGHLMFRTCEIHFDVHQGPPAALEGYQRIEIEFQGDEDERYAARARDALQLPAWVGTDVSDDARYGSKSLIRNGPPR